MVIVYVWDFRGKAEAWGHASMLVDNTYVSWWPEKPGQLPSKVHNNIYASHPFRNRTYSEDVRDEGEPPNHIIRINGLNEKTIKDWWQSFGLTRDGLIYQGPLQTWDTLKRNCSNVVATGLKKGGGDDFANWHKAWNIIWTPQDVFNYAISIQRNISSRP